MTNIALVDRAFLRGCAVQAPSEWDGSEEVLRSLGDDQWSALLVAATEHGFIGLLARNLAWACERAGIDVPILEALERLRRAQLVQHLNRKSAARRVGEAFAASNIPFIALKGIALGEEVYGDLSLRGFRDFDVMVPRDRVDEAFAILLAAGYRLELLDHVREYRDAGAHAAGMVHADGTGVDLHWAISQDLSDASSIDSVWAHTRPAPAGSFLPGLRLTPEMTLVHLAKHFHSHQYAEVKILVDFYVASRRFGSSLDAKQLEQAARALGLETVVEIVARLCERSFQPGSLPPQVTRRRWGLQARLAARVLTDDFLLHSPDRSRLGNWSRFLATAGGWGFAAQSIGRILVPGRLELAQFFRRGYRNGMYPRYYWRQVVKVFTLSNR